MGIAKNDKAHIGIWFTGISRETPRIHGVEEGEIKVAVNAAVTILRRPVMWDLTFSRLSRLGAKASMRVNE